MNRIKTKAIVEITLNMGTIDDFIPNAIKYVISNSIDRSVFTWNGWSYIYRADIKEPDSAEMVLNSYYRYIDIVKERNVIDPNTLTYKDINRKVVYLDKFSNDYLAVGNITSYNHLFIFVDFHNKGYGQACVPSSLRFENEVQDE